MSETPTGDAKPTVEEAVRAALAEWDALPETFTRFNDWTSDSVRGLPGELCRYGREGEDEIIVIDRFRTEEEAEDARLDFERDDMVARIVAALLADRTALVSRIKELEADLSEACGSIEFLDREIKRPRRELREAVRLLTICDEERRKQTRRGLGEFGASAADIDFRRGLDGMIADFLALHEPRAAARVITEES